MTRVECSGREVRDGEGRVWACLAPPGHDGLCFMDQIEGPPYDPGDFGGMST